MPRTSRRADYRIPALDGLRALSILLVMASHSGLQDLVPGVFGVTVFFFISGYLITSLLSSEHARTGTIAVGAFYTRRLLRLYPPLIAFVAISGIAWTASGGRLDLLGVAGALAYLTNYLVLLSPERMQGIGGQLWSLAVEEHFYLVFPWLMLFLLPRRGLIIPALAALCVAALAIRIQVSLADPDFATRYTGMATECRIDAILFGSLAALMRDGIRGERVLLVIARPGILLLASAVLVATLLIRDPFFRNTFRYTLQGIALAAPILVLTSTHHYPRVRALLDSRPFVAVGILSYSLYLWHLAGLDLGAFIAASAGLPKLAGIGLGWISAFLLATASYLVVERPFFALRHRFGSHVQEIGPAPDPVPMPARSL